MARVFLKYVDNCCTTTVLGQQLQNRGWYFDYIQLVRHGRMQDARFCSEFVTVQDEGYAAFMASELNNAFMARCRQRSLGHGTGRWWAQHASLVSRSWCRCLRSILRLLICFARLCRRCKLLRWTSLFCRHLGFPFRQRLLVLV